MVIFFSKDYVKYLPNTQKPKNVSEGSATNDKGETFEPKDRRHVVTKPAPGASNAETINAPPKTPQTPASLAATVSQPDTGIRVKRIVEVKVGTTLSLLARKYYSEANTTLIDHILKLNPEITDPNLILVNQKIKIPEITESLLLLQFSNGVYKVHLGTFLNPNYAARYINDIDLPGQKMEVAPRKVSQKETWYRVLVGPFDSKNEGLKAIEELKQKKLLPSFR
jgi:hypothetical protein